jgi:hypothetical protein
MARVKDHPRRDVALLTFFIEHRTLLRGGWLGPEASRPMLLTEHLNLRQDAARFNLGRHAPRNQFRTRFGFDAAFLGLATAAVDPLLPDWDPGKRGGSSARAFLPVAVCALGAPVV